MKTPISHSKRLFCALLAVCTLLSCGLTAFAADEALTQTNPPPLITITVGDDANAAPVTINGAAATGNSLYPTDVQTVTEDGKQQIIKTYTFSAGESPDNIPRDAFERDGWLYTLTDITQNRTSDTDAKDHIEIVELNTNSKELSDILALLSPTLEYRSEDGYSGLLSLDLSSVKCEAAGYQHSSYAVTATREYPNLPANDLYYIPKSITDNGRTLNLDNVEWLTESTVHAGYSDIPASYRAIAKYRGKATQSAVTGYVTTADYTGEITKAVMNDAIYVAYFSGKEINAAPEESEPTVPPTTKPAQDKDNGTMPLTPIIGITVIIALLGGAAAFLFLRHNVKVYSVSDGGHRVLVAKVRINPKKPVIDLSPLDERLENRCFSLEIDRLTAKSLDGKSVDVVFGAVKLPHKIAYEGNPYQIEADFHEMTIKAIY